MSSILKALRKLEEEKAAIGEGGVDIARDILKRSAEKKESNRFWPILSAVLFLLLAGSGLFFWSEYQATPVPQKQQIAITPAESAKPLPRQIPTPEQVIKAPEQQPSTLIVIKPKEVIKQPALRIKAVALRPGGAPLLKLTGIAYREKAVERIAIINDLPVMQGTAIEGVQIVQILPDRVVFSWENHLFEQKIEKE